MGRILSTIQAPNDIKNIQPSDYPLLAKEIRRKLVRTLSETGGHLASNLGVVELTMALHLCLDFPEDKLVWDVGHQSYVHKMLTGRADEMWTIRQMGGLSGFPSVEEDPSDTFGTGHSSTSISVALGLAKARDLSGEKSKVFAVIGDGALSGGMAYEAMNNAVTTETGLVIVLNDNSMSIAKGVGGMSNYLGKARADIRYRTLKDNIENAIDKIPSIGIPLANQIRKTKDSIKHLLLPGMFFEDMGLTYMGPFNGHNIEEMKTAFETAASMEGETVIVHVVTKKGCGYKPAYEHPEFFHGVDKFDIKTGIPAGSETDHTDTYTDIFGEWLCSAGEKYDDIVSVCAAMPDGTGVSAFFEKYPDRSFDVGIAEEHAVTFAAGLAAGGMRPVVSIYSTFLQRAYDQMLHDVCIQGLPVIFAIDRSGITGRDGRTHQGIFDLAYLMSMPGMTVLSPMDGAELEEALEYAYHLNAPVAVRYPRGEAFKYNPPEVNYKSSVIRPKAKILTRGQEILILAVGDMVKTALEASMLLREKTIRCTVVNMRFVKPFDEELIRREVPRHGVVVTMEDAVASGGFGQMIGNFILQEKLQTRSFLQLSLPDKFIEHGSPAEIYEKYGLDAGSVADRIEKAYHDGKR